MKFLCMAFTLFGLSANSVVFAGEHQETPSWASTTWMAHDTTKHVQMASQYAMSSNYVKALEHLRIAAQRGYPRAQAQIGFYFEEGRGGIDADPVEAVKWYLLSDIPTAIQFAESLEATMTSEQYAEAKARAAAWRPILE